MSNQNYQKNAKVDGAGMRRLTQDEVQGFAGIAGPADHARLGAVRLFGEIEGTLVLCDESLGLHWYDQNDEMHSWQVDGVARLVRELIAVELMTWATRFPQDEINEDLLERLGFESCF